MMIYKYATFDEYHLLNLRKSQLFCRHHADFNDPFEFWAEIQSGKPHPVETPERYARVMQAWGYESSYDETVRDYFDEIEEYEGTISGSFDGIRISCFSRKPDDLLMWSHYGGGLRGFCLGFDEHVLTGNGSALLLGVDYARHPPVVDEFEYALLLDQIWYYEFGFEHKLEGKMGAEYQRAWTRIGDILRAGFATKPRDWAYEAESRLILQRQPAGPSLHRYDKQALKCVVVGQKASDEDRSRLKEALAEVGLAVPIYSAGRSSSSYELKILASDK